MLRAEHPAKAARRSRLDCLEPGRSVEYLKLFSASWQGQPRPNRLVPIRRLWTFPVPACAGMIPPADDTEPSAGATDGLGREEGFRKPRHALAGRASRTYAKRFASIPSRGRLPPDASQAYRPLPTT